MNRSESIHELSAALSAFQGEAKDPQKLRKGYESRYTYANLADYLTVARPLLPKHGLGLVQSVGATESGMFVISLLTHSSGQWIESDPLVLPVEPRKGMSQAQCAGTVLSYARRYSAAAILGLASEDDDGQSVREAPDLISEEQVAELRRLLAQFDEETGPRFLKAYGVSDLSELASSRYAGAVAALHKKGAK